MLCRLAMYNLDWLPRFRWSVDTMSSSANLIDFCCLKIAMGGVATFLNLTFSEIRPEVPFGLFYSPLWESKVSRFWATSYLAVIFVTYDCSLIILKLLDCNSPLFLISCSAFDSFCSFELPLQLNLFGRFLIY